MEATLDAVLCSVHDARLGAKEFGRGELWTAGLLWLYNNIVHLIIVHSNRTSASTGLPEQQRHFTMTIMPSYADFTQYFF